LSNNNGTKTKARHIVNISGGKDSSALAIYLSKRDFWRKQLGKADKRTG
jgi:tRNA(Ile)-lysidine synthase TilS/MesJ